MQSSRTDNILMQQYLHQVPIEHRPSSLKADNNYL